MKVIFLKDVPRVGKRHDVKEVNDGYALNFLFPHKLAETATASALAQLERRQKEIIIEKEVKENLLEKSLEEIKGKTVHMTAPANEKGHLFSAIHKKEIAEVMHKENHIEIGEEFIAIEKPIKEIGEFEIPVLIKKKRSFFKLIVIKE